MFFARSICFAAALTTATLSGAASAAVIDFDNYDASGPGPYGGQGTPFTSTTEDGYTAAVTSGEYIQDLFTPSSTPNYHSPSIATGYYASGNGYGTVDAALTVTGPGLFTFDSFDVGAYPYSEDPTPSTYTITGYLGDELVFTSAGLAPYISYSDDLATVSGPSTAGVDRVVISTHSDNYLWLDNIVLSPAAAAAVPEPATWAMLISGFGLVGGALRRPGVRFQAA